MIVDQGTQATFCPFWHEDIRLQLHAICFAKFDGGGSRKVEELVHVAFTVRRYGNVWYQGDFRHCVGISHGGRDSREDWAGGRSVDGVYIMSVAKHLCLANGQDRTTSYHIIIE